jgi:hypothetical protein
MKKKPVSSPVAPREGVPRIWYSRPCQLSEKGEKEVILFFSSTWRSWDIRCVSNSFCSQVEAETWDSLLILCHCAIGRDYEWVFSLFLLVWMCLVSTHTRYKNLSISVWISHKGSWSLLLLNHCGHGGESRASYFSILLMHHSSLLFLKTTCESIIISN